jgi:hypothetical protein
MSTRWTGKNLSVDRDEIHADSGSINPRVSRFLSKSPTQKLVAGSYFGDVKMPGALPVIVSAFLLLVAAVFASWLPAARAARVDVMQALRSE